MIKNKGIISAFAKIIIPLSYKSYLRVLLPQTAEICTIPKSLPRSFQNNFKCLFFKRLYQIDEILKYKSLFDTELSYVKPQIILEIGSRSLFEPTQKALVASMITSEFPEIQTSVVHREITTAVPGKTFLEKAFLLHELFTTAGCEKAERKSRHLYDLEKMMDCDFALAAINDDNLWEAISNHREKFTHVNGVDYSPDVRDRIVLTPPAECLQVWEADYVRMQKSMIYGDSLSFDALLGRMRELEERFHMNAVERRFSDEMKPKTSFV